MAGGRYPILGFTSPNQGFLKPEHLIISENQWKSRGFWWFTTVFFHTLRNPVVRQGLADLFGQIEGLVNDEGLIESPSRKWSRHFQKHPKKHTGQDVILQRLKCRCLVWACLSL